MFQTHRFTDRIAVRFTAVSFVACAVALGLAGHVTTAAGAGMVLSEEMNDAHRWAAARFQGVVEPVKVEPGLLVLANNDPVQKNARAGKPMRIADRQYTRGLYCHATSKIVVRLPGPAKEFTATAGVDSNENTSGGRGSVVFAVKVGGKEAFRSKLLREGMPGVPVKVDLGGATEFVLEVEDGGDGISCDQADWVDARVTLADGSARWLGEMPLLTGRRKAASTEFPFSFTFGGQPSAQLLRAWNPTRAKRALDERRVEHTLTCTDPKSGLVVRCVAIEYLDYPTVEWTVYLKNAGSTDTPLVENLQALDAEFECGGETVLHHGVGSPCEARDYQPLETVLKPEAATRIAAAGGRPSNSDLPYFNVAWPGEGMIVVVGWPGQWAAEFQRDKQLGLRVRAGQEQTRFKLHPGEEVRTPLVVLQFWKGDRIRSQNVWRRWMLDHSLPRPGGKLPPVQLAACSSHQFGEMINANTANQKLFIDRYLAEGLKLDYWWMDAGWYPNKSGWGNTGTWEVDTRRFPGGLRSICDHAHAKGVKTIVWFEPERVTDGTWLTENHPDWILGGKAGGLLNLGNPAALEWLIGHVDKLLTTQAIDLYRQDFNMDPLGHWRQADPPDRQGITENKHVVGYLAYWDALRRRHPDMLIDSCASGGRRNDLETLRRAVPLLRSDYIMEPIGNQGHTYGISFWMPYHGTGTGSGPVDPYLLRSVMCPHFTACFDVRRRDLDYAMIRRVMGEWRDFAPNYFGDYYPLTPYSLAPDAWIAWQFDRPEQGEGMVQAFRRPESYAEACRFKLRGLEAAARYTVRSLDASSAIEATGQELMEKGLLVTISDQPGSAVVTYKKHAPTAGR
jgi:alpha-galactosidase